MFSNHKSNSNSNSNTIDSVALSPQAMQEWKDLCNHVAKAIAWIPEDSYEICETQIVQDGNDLRIYADIKGVRAVCVFGIMPVILPDPENIMTINMLIGSSEWSWCDGRN